MPRVKAEDAVSNEATTDFPQERARLDWLSQTGPQSQIYRQCTTIQVTLLSTQGYAFITGLHMASDI